MKLIFFFLLIILSDAVFAQDSSFQSITGVPTSEVYDLLKDSKGYLWLGHDLGLSRYDGRNFVNFSTPQQNALAMTNLVEDSQGHIWCHNFEGQIFYTDNFKLNLLKSYLFEEEKSYPKIGILGNELIATSCKGLFILNTKTFESKYYFFKKGTSSLTILKDKVLLYGIGDFYIYHNGNVIKENITSLGFTGNDVNGKSLQINSLNDTAFLVSNPAGYYFKLNENNSKLIISKKIKGNGFINTITINKNEAWIHTKSISNSEYLHDSILNYNLTDLERDKDGNIFYSSLTNGLSINYANPPFYVLNFPFLAKTDFLRKIIIDNTNIICGTQKGQILLFKNEFNKKARLLFPQINVPIEQLKKINSNIFIAGTANGIFRISLKEPKMVLIDSIVVLKDLLIKAGDVFFVSPDGLQKIALNKLLEFNPVTNYHPLYEMVKQGRARNISSDESNAYILCSFSDGLYKIDGNKVSTILFNGQSIYATSIQNINHKYIIGTFNQGIFIIDNEKIKNITTKDGLISNSIKDIKVFNTHAWIIFDGFIQKMDDGFKLFPIPEIPSKGLTIFDIVEKKDEIFLATNKGLYKVEPNVNQPVLSSSVIDFILINGKDTVINQEFFSNYQNNLQINLSTPYFNPFSSLRYKYRFYKGEKTNWLISEEDQKVFSLISLQPGKYIFEAVAVNATGIPVAFPIKQIIQIAPAFYQTTLFKICIAILATTLLFIMYRFRVNQLLKMENIRKNISSDLHDDIGSTLSSINIYTGLAKKHENNGSYLDIITLNVTEVINKLDDMVWSINPKYDNTSSMIRRIESYAVPLAQAKGIEFYLIADNLSEKTIPLEIKHNLFLIIKELVNNAVKHSNCKKITLHLRIEFNLLLVDVKDDGNGYDIIDASGDRNGLINIARRVASIKGSIIINDSAKGNGTNTTIKIHL